MQFFRHFLFISSAILVLSACGNQEETQQVPTTQEQMISHYQQVLTQALQYEDYPTAVSTIHSLMALDSRFQSYQDSLPEYYIKAGDLLASITTIDYLLEKRPTNLDLLEKKAVVEQEIGNYPNVIQTYNQLYAQSKDIEYIFALANYQANTERFQECLNTVDSIFGMIDTTKDSIEMVSGENSKQFVSAKAAAYHFKGVIYIQLRQFQKAKQMIQSALKEEPEFFLARRNLEMLSQQ